MKRGRLQMFLVLFLILLVLGIVGRMEQSPRRLVDPAISHELERRLAAESHDDLARLMLARNSR